MDRRFLFLLSSARKGGNALALAQAAAAPIPAAAQVWIDLCDPPLPAFTDLRPGFALPHGPVAQIHAAMREASDIVMVAPIYWYALPAPAKLLLDHWSGWLDAPETGFADWVKGKRMHLVTARADPDPTVPDLAEAMLRRSAEWLGMVWGGALHGIGDAPGEVSGDRAAMTAARRFLGSDLR
ncbi:flavodoxin [Tabrizicola sp. TH137]|uniref:NAD(P)H-dependent oxidoreductase n=1 Tax=Tabrizicola sp. TH137 TaxID=2067452 RepID=UPI000C7CE0D7|nr:NAD(P)H-dependent oxidoreductase [Tabrizicola sp. TH137]PLL13074.1 flavodoxin [Tabrizicola sp. TH137]